MRAEYPSYGIHWPVNTGYLYPVFTGQWIPYDGYSARMWFSVWI